MARHLLLLLRIGVFVGAVGVLIVRLRGGQGTQAWAGIMERMGAAPFAAMALFLLMLLNWALEAEKWRGLVRPVQAITPARAFKATLAGTSVGLITPNRVGEFVGRVLYLEPGNRLPGAFATILGSATQAMVTMWAGGCCLLHLAPTMPVQHAWSALAWVALAGAVLGLFICLHPAWLARALRALPWPVRYRPDPAFMEHYGQGDIWRAIGLSALRYLVFTLQYVLVLKVLVGMPAVEALFRVPVVFMVTTLVPTTALTEIGVRGSVALTLLQGDPWAITLASLLLWAVNLMLPAMVGSVLVLLARTSRTR